MLPVDGFSAETNEVFEMQGCRFHGHPCKMNPNHEEEEMKLRYKKTLEKREYIEKLGYKLVEMWECDFMVRRHVYSICTSMYALSQTDFNTNC